MPFIPVYSRHLSDAKIRSIFCTAKFGKRISCRWCGKYTVSRYTPGYFRCRSCWRKFTITTGTFLAKRRYPLRFWYEIIWCFTLSQPAYKAHRLLGTPYASLCWEGYHIIRQAIVTASIASRDKIVGTVEIDESYFGGEFKNLRKSVRQKLREEGLAKRGRGAKYRKQPVFGIYKRNGEIFLELLPDTTAKELEPRVKDNIEKGSVVYTDDHTGYANLVGLGYLHATINHGENEYAVGKIHINGLEGFWGLSKNTLAILQRHPKIQLDFLP